MATIIPCQDKHVWGVLWKLDIEHLASLDKQEGAPKKYKRRRIEVEMVKQ